MSEDLGFTQVHMLEARILVLGKKKKERALGNDKIMMMQLMMKEIVLYEPGLRELFCPSTM